MRNIDLASELATLPNNFVGSRKDGFPFETSTGLPISARNIARDNLHPILKKMGRAKASKIGLGFKLSAAITESLLDKSKVLQRKKQLQSKSI